MSNVITVGNFKGGVGKTTNSVMLSYILNEKGYKVLMIDFDPQANATKFLTNTFDVNLSNFTSIYEAIEKQKLSDAILNLTEGFHLLPSALDLVNFKDFLTEKIGDSDKSNKHYFLKFLLEDIKDNYDFVIIDIPPTISEFSNNAITASDYALIVMQTDIDSLLGAIEFNDYVNEMQQFNPNVDVVGVLPYFRKKRSRNDKYIFKTSRTNDALNIKNLMFKSYVYDHDRVQTFRVNGITNKDHHDKTVFKMYNGVTDELIKKVGIENG
ncbi:ParA family protein [Oceanobacillus timonensis]|uniref:ParA family protein n=1 Tax=Oceanobacillus timonensis TaxID=1926285 RepID=UPI0009BB80F6|nr:AAA family ATPase [Oceanobacillus timonensis]